MEDISRGRTPHWNQRKPALMRNSRKLIFAAKLQEWQNGADPRLVEADPISRIRRAGGIATVRAGRNEGDGGGPSDSLDWVAVAHFNTEHPHVHVALRGVDKNGIEFKLPRST